MLMMKQLQQITRRNLRIASLGIDMQLRLLAWRDEAPIVVYQMGKVGSSTVVASLKASMPQKPIYHIHSLTREGIEHGKQMYARIFNNERRTDARRMKHLLTAEQLYKRAAGGRAAPKWKVITLVRDPVARNISDFFQVIGYWFTDFEERSRSGELGMDDVIATFMREYHHEEPLSWFDIELKQSLDIDVFATRFPKQQGYEIYRRGPTELLVLKLEHMARCAQEAFRAFIGVNNIQIIDANISSDKEYHMVYRQFQEDVRLPGDYLDKMYESKYARHFYTQDEIQSFKAKWRR